MRLALLTGRDGRAAKKETLKGLADGAIQLVVGTHALVQEDVEFADLAPGRGRRAAPLRRAPAHGAVVEGPRGRPAGDDRDADPAHPDAGAYGDLDVSELTEKPAGRQPIDTRTLPLERIDEVVDGRRPRDRHAARGSTGSARWSRRARTIDLAAAEERFAELRARFPGKVGLVHGRMKGAEREAAMAAFAAGAHSILVATTVIEVGVDVPEATVMVIEHAERFGLAQLHQLRGRVGRGARPVDLPAALRPAARRDRQGAARRSCARPRTASASPRRICACAAPARCWGRGNPALPVFRLGLTEAEAQEG